MRTSKICKKCDFYLPPDKENNASCALDKHFDVLWINKCDSFSKTEEAFQKELEEKTW